MQLRDRFRVRLRALFKHSRNGGRVFDRWQEFNLLDDAAFRIVGPDNISDEEVIRQIASVPRHRAYLGFGIPFELVANSSTAKTNAGVQPAANQAVVVAGFNMGFDGTNSANGPGIGEICQCTFATNAPGTNSTTVTPAADDQGRPETIQAKGGKNWTAEPTVLTVIEAHDVPTYMGNSEVYRPLTKPLIAKGGGGIALRVTLPSSVTANATGSLPCTE